MLPESVITYCCEGIKRATQLQNRTELPSRHSKMLRPQGCSRSAVALPDAGGVRRSSPNSKGVQTLATGWRNLVSRVLTAMMSLLLTPGGTVPAIRGSSEATPGLPHAEPRRSRLPYPLNRRSRAARESAEPSSPKIMRRAHLQTMPRNRYATLRRPRAQLAAS